MDRSDFFYRQKVTEGELDQAFDYCEAADRAIIQDLGFFGILSGLVASQHTPHNLTVDVLGGASRSPQGERVAVPSTQTVSLAVDWQSVTTAVNTPGNSKVISLFIKSSRTLQFPRTDGNGANVYYDRLESFRWFVTQGAEAVSPSAPPLEADGLLIADITIAYAQTQIIDANISTARREDQIVLTGSPFNGRYGTVLAALQAIVTRYDNMVSGTGDVISGATMAYLGSSPTLWADGTGLAAGTTESAFDGIVLKLGAITLGASGDFAIGVQADAAAATPLAAGPLVGRLQSLRNATSIVYLGSGTWADGSTIGVGSVEAAIDAVPLALGVAAGASRVGLALTGGFSAGSVLGGFQQLVLVSANNDGMKRIGAEVKGSFTTNTGRGQLDELDATRVKLTANNVITGNNTISGNNAFSGANTHTGAETFGNIAVTAGNHYKLPAGTSITRAQTGYWSTNAGNTWTPVSAIFNLGAGSFAIGEHGEMLLLVPHGATITSIAMWLSPANHASIAGMSKPEIQFFKWSASGAAQTFIDQVTDPSASAAAYSLKHLVTLSGLTEVVDRTDNIYYARLVVEQGANANGLVPPVVLVTYTLPNVDDGY